MGKRERKRKEKRHFNMHIFKKIKLTKTLDQKIKEKSAIVVRVKLVLHV